MTEIRLPPFKTALLLVKDKMRESGSRIFSLSTLRKTVDAAITPWAYGTARPSNGKIIEKLIEDKVIRHLILKSAEYRNISRYAYGHISMLELATNLRENSYLSHWTAAYVHGLTPQTAPTVYVNKEQTPKTPPKGPLSQKAIDRAFTSRQRRSKYIFEMDTHTFTLLNGKHTNNQGVITMLIGGRAIRITDIPRTLIDITVRPGYAGGIIHVAEIFKAAWGKFELEALLSILQQINHKYPFHQAIGYYLTAAGVPYSDTKPLRDLGVAHQFYLDYGIIIPHFDDDWQIYVPVELANSYKRSG